MTLSDRHIRASHRRSRTAQSCGCTRRSARRRWQARAYPPHLPQQRAVPRRPVWDARIHACDSDAWRAVHAGTRRRGPTRHRRTRCARLTMRDQDMLLDALAVPVHVQLRHAAANRSSNQSTSEAPRRSRRLDNGPTSAPGPGPTAHAATCPHRRTLRPAHIGARRDLPASAAGWRTRENASSSARVTC